jgi:PAS domain S-box-containing protein
MTLPGDLEPRTRRRARQAEDADLFRLLVDRVVDYAIFLLTPDGHVASWNAGAEHLKGYRANEIIGHSFERFYTAEDRAAGLPARLLATARAEGRVEHEGWRVRQDGSRFWADVVITALANHEGQLVGFAKVTRDLTARRQTEQERARRMAAERALNAELEDRVQRATTALEDRLEALRMLSEASALLASSLEYHTTLQRVVRVAVPFLADWSSFDIVEDDGSAHGVAVAHADAARESSLREIQQRYPPDTRGPRPVSEVLRTGRSVLLAEVSESMLRETSRD